MLDNHNNYHIVMYDVTKLRFKTTISFRIMFVLYTFYFEFNV
jgi:hypothetical protein